MSVSMNQKSGAPQPLKESHDEWAQFGLNDQKLSSPESSKMNPESSSMRPEKKQSSSAEATVMAANDTEAEEKSRFMDYESDFSPQRSQRDTESNFMNEIDQELKQFKI